jgi:hypothetical protein
MKNRKKPNGFETVHDKLYFRKTMQYVRAVMKHFKSYKDEDDGN